MAAEPRGGDEAATAYLLKEFEHLSDSFLRNEELGDRRVNLFLTLATGVLAVIAATQPSEEHAWALGLSGVALFGVLTFRRIVWRNVKSDEYKRAIAMVRRHFLERDPTLGSAVLYSDPGTSRPRRAWGHGGLSETLTVANSVAAGAVPAVTLWSTSTALAVLAAAATGVLAAFGHWLYADRVYKGQSTSARR